MNQKINTYYLIAFSAIILLIVSTPVISQQILNVTEIPHHAVGFTNPEEIRKEGDTYYVPIFRAKNGIFEYLPEMEVDSFYTPISPESGNINPAAMYAMYTPNIGFTDHLLLNFMTQFDKLSFDNERVCFAGMTPAFGFNDNIAYPYPETIDEFYKIVNRIGVYDISLDSFLFLKSFAEGAKYDITSALDGDFVYINIPLTYSEDEDLIFIGDTLSYPPNTHVTVGCNYLSKINYITGEKIWTRHIGYGDVEKIIIDDSHRLNIDMITGVPVSLDFEWIHVDSATYYGQYDRLIYRMSPDGEYLDDTYIHTHGDAAIYEVEINEDGSFQAFGKVEYPMVVNVEGDSLDFSDAYSFDESKGLVLAYDENLDFQWGHKIKTDGFTLITAANKTPKGDYIISTVCRSEWIDMDNKFFQGPSAPDYIEGEFYQSILTRLSAEGHLLGEPQFGTHLVRISDIQSFGEHHFLILFEKIGIPGVEFLGETYALGAAQYSIFIEYEGDIYNLMTTVNEYFEKEEYSIWPNPAKAGQSVNISVPDIIVDKTITVSLISENGTVLDTQEIEHTTNLKYTLPTLAGLGNYYIRLSIAKGQVTKPLIIH